jgi:hypothetical protein
VLSPTELIRAAHAAGLDCLALTDHDSLAGIDEAQAAAREHGLELIAGVELSIRDDRGVDDHLLGFFIDPEAPAMRNFLERMQRDREDMARRTLLALERLGMSISRGRVNELAKGAVVTRPHIARAMVEAGYVQTEQEAFDRYLGSGKPAAQARPSPDAVTAIAMVTEAGGVAALAHPVFPQDADALTRLQALPRRLDAMAEAGLRAVECDYPDSDPGLTKQLHGLAQQRRLIVTGGSDYHGPAKAPGAPLGQPSVDADVVEQLRSARPTRREWRT